MNKDKSKFVKETIDYLNFIKKYNSFPLFNDGLFVEDVLKKLEIMLNTETAGNNEIITEQINKVSDVIIKDTVIKNEVKDIPSEIKSIIPKKEEVKKYPELSIVNELHELNEIVKSCTKCGILSQFRNNTVFGSGNEKADIVVVGEAPGSEEDKQGLPFVGRAGKLLTDILKAINFTREEVYICNILKCRPPDNRNPMPDEINNCEPYLFTQLKIIKPKLILALGTFASQTLLRSKEPLGKLRGRFHTYEGIKMMVTYHPAALLRNPNWKKPTWEDVKMLRSEYDKMK